MKGFDGLRGLAAIAVVLTHLNALAPISRTEFFVMVHGSTGVQLFFVLSGFLITMLLIREHDAHGSISLPGFFLRRACRILPLYLLFLAIVTVIDLFVCDVTPDKGLGFAYAYLYNFVPKDLYSRQLGHTWSLAVEEHFYLLWPLLFLLYYKNRRKLLFVSSFLVLVSIAFNLLLDDNLFLQNRFHVERFTFISGANILIGCLLALCLCGAQKSKIASACCESNASLLMGLACWGNSFFFQSTHFGHYLRAVGFALLIAWIFLNQRSRLVSLLEFPPLRFCGVISYGIYIYQGLFLTTGPYRVPGQAWPPSPQVGVILLCIVAPASFYLFEKPFLKVGSRFRRVTISRPDNAVSATALSPS